MTISPDQSCASQCLKHLIDEVIAHAIIGNELELRHIDRMGLNCISVLRPANDFGWKFGNILVTVRVVTPLAIQLTTLSLRLQTYERIPDSTQDDQNNVNLDRTNRFVLFQLLTGWHA